MKKILKKILDIVLLLVIALAILMALVEGAYYYVTADLREIDRQNKADPVYQKVMAEVAEKEKAEKERQEKLEKMNEKKAAEYKAILDFEESVEGKYTREYLLDIIVTDKKMADRMFNIGGYDCMNYWYTSHNWDDEECYDELSYYVFKNEKCAKKAFAFMKDNWIERETDSGKHYVQGWEADVMDADVEVFIYQTDNMIIFTELQVASDFYDASEEDGNSAVAFYYRRDFIKDEF